LGLVLVSSVEGIKFLISILGPDDKSSKVASRGKEKDVQTVNVKDVNTRKVAERSEKGSLLFINDQGSFSLDVSPVASFSFTGSDLLGISNFFNISISFQDFKEFDNLGSLFNGIDGVGTDNKRNFRNFLDSMTSSKDKGCR